MYQYKCIILNVIDGDSVKVDIDVGFNIWVKNLSIRLIGLDTPALKADNPTDKAYGQLCRTVVQKMLPIGSTQVIKTTIEDKYGRILGDFLFENDTLCTMLLREGYAVPYKGQNKAVIADLHECNKQRLIAENKLLVTSTVPVV